MNDNENRTRQTFARVHDLFTARASDFATNSLASTLAHDLAIVITELDGHAANEASATGSKSQGTSSRSQARDELRADLEAINRTARAMTSDVPGLNDRFRLPAVGNDQHLLAAARAAAIDAVPLSAQFIAHEMPADFLADLDADIAKLETAISEQSTGVGHHAAASAAIDDAISRGVEIVRKLDAIFRNKYANDPATLAEWTSASHTERAPRQRKPKTSQTSGAGGSTPPNQ